MPNDYEVNVIITEHSTHWAWKVECLGQFVASGTAPSVYRALRIARQYSKEDSYEFGLLKLIGRNEEHGMAHYLYGANLTIHQ